MKNGYDPYEDALRDTPESADFFGQLHVEAYQGFFRPGARGGVPYDEAAHGPDQWKMLLIDVTYTPIDPTRKVISDTLARTGAKDKETGKRKPSEFLLVFQPAVMGLTDRIAEVKGLTVGQFNVFRQISGMYLRATWVPRPSGDGYNCLKPISIFDTEDACRGAYEEVGGTVQQAMPFTPEEVEAADDPQRAMFAKFLEPLWAQAKTMTGGDTGSFAMSKMAELIEASPELKARFTLNDPEVQEVIWRDERTDDISF